MILLLIIQVIITILLFCYVIYYVNNLRSNVNVIYTMLNNTVDDTTIVDRISELDKNVHEVLQSMSDARVRDHNRYLVILEKLSCIIKKHAVKESKFDDIDNMLDSIESKVLLALSGIKKVYKLSQTNDLRIANMITTLDEISYNVAAEYIDSMFPQEQDQVEEDEAENALQNFIDGFTNNQNNEGNTTVSSCKKIIKLAHSKNIPTKVNNVKLLTFNENADEAT